MHVQSSGSCHPSPVTRHGRYVDLHLHSTCSDGLYPPAEVVAMAARLGLAAVAICDHDNIDGTEEALAAGERLGVEAISGVELSVLWQEYEDIHLLGYGFDHRDPALNAELAGFRAFRAGRNAQIVARVNDKLAGEGKTPIDFARVQEKAGGTLGRPHIAQALVEAGHVAASEEAFARYLVPCNVPKRFFPIDEAIALIHAAGGVAVLAHPPFITDSPKRLERLIETFAGMGLDGVEAWNSGADNNTVDRTITIARRQGLIVTGGTDFHGSDGEQLIFGGVRGNLRIPYGCVDELRSALARRAAQAQP